MDAVDLGMTVEQIPPDQVGHFWPVLWPLLARAARRTPGLPEAPVRALVEGGDAQLWAILQRNAPIAAVATQVTLVPEKRCRLWLVGGSHMNRWAPLFLATVEPWARSLGCLALWGTQSRAGWTRIVRAFDGARINGADGSPAWGRRI